MFTRLVNPVLIVNQQHITVVSNSIEIDLGYPDRSVQALSAGGGFVDIVSAEDFSTYIGIVKFKLLNDSQHMEQYGAWQSIDPNIGNIITITDEASGFSAVWVNMIIINKVNIPLSYTGEFDVEFHGKPAIRGG